MGDKRVIDYFKNYKDQYGLEHLKKKVLSMGYTHEDISDALIELGKKGGEKSEESKDNILNAQGALIQDSNVSVSKTGLGPVKKTPVQNPALQISTTSNLTNIPAGAVSSKPAVSTQSLQQTQPVQPNVNNGSAEGPAVLLDTTFTPQNLGIDEGMKTKGSAWFKIAGIAGILGFLLSIVASFPIGAVVKKSLMLGSLFLFLFYFIGFIILGKRHNKKLILVVSWIFIILIFLSMILVIAMMIKPDFELVSTSGLSSAVTLDDFLGAIKAFGAKELAIIGSVFGVMFILGILLGVGFLKLKNDIKLAKVTGLLFIIGTITTLILIGFLILFVAFVLSVVVLTKENFEKDNFKIL